MQWDNTEYAGFSNAEPWIPIPIKGRAISVSTQMSDSDSIYVSVNPKLGQLLIEF